ncbi:MAG: Calx-beta domain-containing protein [Bacteriovoracia bacterium]
MQRCFPKFFSRAARSGLSLAAGVTALAFLSACGITNKSGKSDTKASFSSGGISVSEASPSVQIPVVLSQSVQFASSVSYSIVGGSAINGSDFTAATSGSLSFPAGSRVAYINVNLIQNAVVNSDRTVVFKLSGAKVISGIGAQSSFTLTIVDDDSQAEVNFSTSAQTVAEAAGTALVTATLATSKSFDVTIPVSVSGTATQNVDYTLSGTTITIPAGSTSASLTVNLVSDGVVDADETIIFTMDTPTNATVGSINSQTITITDSGGTALPTVSFSAATQLVSENAGSVTVTVDLSVAAPAATVVPIFIGSGTATEGADFSLSSTSLSYAIGEISKSFTVTIVDDTASEGTESIVLGIGTPVNATVGATGTQTISITDNDAAAFSITSVNPDSGPAQGENRVTVYGNGFTGVTSVTLAGIACGSVNAISSNELTCIAGAGAAGTGDADVTVAGPTTTTLVNAYTYLDWTPTAAGSAPAARYFHSSVWTGSEMIIWGGTNEVGTYFGNGARFNPATNSWTTIAASATNEPSSRGDHTGTWTGSQMIIWGGTNGTSYLADGAKFTPVLGTWTAMASTSAPSARSRHTATWCPDGLLAVWGGFNGTALGSGARYNPTADTWVAMTAPPAAVVPRFGHTAVLSLSSGLFRLIIWGGSDGSNELSSGGMYNLSGGTWTTTQTTGVPSGRTGHSAIWDGSSMIVWGGVSSTIAQGGGAKFTPPTTAVNGGTWVTISNTSAPAARESHSTVWTGLEMLVWGGRNGSSIFNDGGRYNSSLDSWTTISTTGAPTARFDQSAEYTGDRMIVWGGNDGAAALASGSQFFAPNASSNTWTATAVPTSPALAARQYHSAVWTGSEIILWGGSTLASATDCVNTGARFNPATNAWSTVGVSTTSAPTARCEHSAVWTGGRMIIWGGRTAANVSTATGGLYSPVANTWTTALAGTGTNNPSARFAHSAVWTGQRMIIWGGIDSGTTKSDGFIYNPDATTTALAWTALPSTGTPAARLRHVAVWTGSQMIIWGGKSAISAPTYFATGAIYDLAGNTWTATAAGSAPTGREGHTAVWTGSRMIVWGGYDGSSRLNTGAELDPIGNAWTVLTTTNAPTARSDHSAVWTGTKMIIWGGFSTGSAHTGAEYNPTSTSWTVMTTNSAPAGRFRHTAIWTGDRMVILGGVDNGTSIFNTGGMYIP